MLSSAHYQTMRLGMPDLKKDPTLSTFAELGLIAPLLKAIDGAGYTTPSPIQEKAIKPILDGHDLLGIAQTGTGKTAAFALPILQRLAADKKPAPRKGCRVLVLSPTRELATQIAEHFRMLGEHMGVSVAVVFGGVSHRPQTNALARGVDVLVATPGRLLDHVAERNAVLNTTEVLVLDEADQMLDLGFFKPIRRIVAQLPQQRQSLFFSATMPKEIELLTAELLRNPVKVEVAPRATTVELINQRVIHVEHNRKRALLVELLADSKMSRTLVFTRTKRGADKVVEHNRKRALLVELLPMPACRGRWCSPAPSAAPTRSPSTSTTPASTCRRSTATRASASARKRSTPSATATSACWWRPISRRAASTSAW